MSARLDIFLVSQIDAALFLESIWLPPATFFLLYELDMFIWYTAA